MKLEILSDETVSPNLHDASKACCAVQSATHPDGRVFCVYRRGVAKHGADGVMLMQSSADGGKSWDSPSIVFDRTDLRVPQSVVCGGIVVVGDTLLSSFTYAEMPDPEVFIFSDEGWALGRDLVVSRSEDGGATWLDPVVIDTADVVIRIGVPESPFLLPDGDVCVPLEVQGPGGGRAAAAVFSSDQGRTFSRPELLVDDHEGKLSQSDARFTRLLDGSYLMHLWTCDRASGQTLPVHQSRSVDGRTWCKPEPIGIEGQISSPVEISPGFIITVANHRMPPEGNRLWWSHDGGQTWNTSPIQMWSVKESCIIGEPVPQPTESKEQQRWDQTQNFSFGSPKLQRLQDGTILLMYFATVDDIIHIRACRFAVA